MVRPVRRLARRPINTPFIIPAVAGAALALGGCVSEGAYDDLQTANRSLSSRNASLTSELEEAESLAGTMRQQTQRQLATIADLRDTNTELRNQLSSARDSIAALEDRLGSIEIGGLDPVTGSALERLAERYPDRLSYDDDRGMLRFASDFTFASGSAQVRDEIMPAIDALADILASPDASGYDVIIVGHTDAQQPGDSTRQRHPTNMHLSAHRAISVRGQLAQRGINPGRMQAAGWGEQRPAVPNNPDGNTPANRRVEIFLVPAGTASAPATTGRTAEPEADQRPQFDPIK